MGDLLLERDVLQCCYIVVSNPETLGNWVYWDKVAGETGFSALSEFMLCSCRSMIPTCPVIWDG